MQRTETPCLLSGTLACNVAFYGTFALVDALTPHSLEMPDVQRMCNLRPWPLTTRRNLHLPA
jgi:hypothetical protein